MFGSYFLVIRRKSRSSVKMKPRSAADKAECIDMTYSVITPLGNTNNLNYILFFLLIKDQPVKDKSVIQDIPVTSELMYEPVTSSDCKRAPPPPSLYSNINQPLRIPKVQPIPVSGLGPHVANCHLDNSKIFDEQYKVRERGFRESCGLLY